MPIKLANNASGTLATAISASDTGLVLTTGDGAEFPTLSAGDYFYATITSSGGTQEIVKATARSGDSLTVVRAQEGTSAAGFAAGSRFELRVTAQSVEDIADDIAVVYDAALRADLAASSGSSRVGFLQSGVSAAASTVQAKLRETVSVLDFGADPTGATYSTTAIQNAIATGSSLYFPEGTYKINGTLTGNTGGWFGAGWTKTTISCVGSNGGTPFLKPPQQFDGIQILGDGTAGSTGLQLGQEYSFTGHIHWENLRIRGFELGIRMYNFYTVLFSKVDVVYNTNGIRVTPLHNGGDNGYFTTWQMDSCLIGYGSGIGIWVDTPLGCRNWNMFNCVVEGFGSTGTFKGTWSNSTAYSTNDCVAYNWVRYKANAATSAGEQPGVSAKWDAQTGFSQIALNNCKLNAVGLYIEGNPGTPAIAAYNGFISATNIKDPYFNGTGGVYAGSGAISAIFESGSHVTTSDKTLWWAGSSIQSLININTDVTPTVPNTQRTSSIGFLRYRVPRLMIGDAGLSTIDKGLNLNLAYRKSLSGVTVSAGGSTTVITNEYYNAITGGGYVGMANITGEFQPNIIGVVTPANTGNVNYFCVVLHNVSASPITFGANAYVNVLLLKSDYTDL